MSRITSVAACCSVLQCVAVCCIASLYHVAHYMCCSVLQHVAVCCIASWYHVARFDCASAFQICIDSLLHCKCRCTIERREHVLQRVAACCSALQCVWIDSLLHCKCRCTIEMRVHVLQRVAACCSALLCVWIDLLLHCKCLHCVSAFAMQFKLSYHSWWPHCASANMWICEYGNMGIWESVNMGIWKYGKMEIWKYRNMGIWVSGNVYILGPPLYSHNCHICKHTHTHTHTHIYLHTRTCKGWTHIKWRNTDQNTKRRVFACYHFYHSASSTAFALSLLSYAMPQHKGRINLNLKIHGRKHEKTRVRMWPSFLPHYLQNSHLSLSLTHMKCMNIGGEWTQNWRHTGWSTKRRVFAWGRHSRHTIFNIWDANGCAAFFVSLCMYAATDTATDFSTLQ